jgi:iron complex outermembrane receptor protein
MIMLAGAAPAQSAAPEAGRQIPLAAARPDIGGVTLETVLVTARLREEDAQAIPVSLSAVNAHTLAVTATNNVAQMTQLVPGLNYVAPNPRNTAFTIRGLGSSVVAVSQANDGLEPGVGFYVDQVYHARPATAAFDFVDLERVEVLRGPQGTLFGKNTTAGAINITTQAPSFEREANVELSAGNPGYLQGKASLSGPVAGDVLAGRISAAVTQRGGVLRNVTTGGSSNAIGNAGIRGQLLYQPTDAFKLRISADYSAFESNCCTQVYFGVGTTLKPAARQYPALAAGQGYAPPSFNPFDRLTDIDADLKVDTDEGGLSAIAEWNIGTLALTSVSAWRWWNWDAANDRDYTRLSIQTVQHIPSRQDQYSEELRIASTSKGAADFVAGLYWFAQVITGEPITQYGPLAAYWLLGPSPAIPGNLLDGYVTDGRTRFESNSYAAFGEASWHVTDNVDVTGGLRYTVENKSGRFDSTVSGGLATTDTALINSKLSILRPQSYAASDSDSSPAGRVNVAYRPTDHVIAYLSYARGSKSGGINMSGLPLNATNQPALATAVIRPEKNTTLEIGVKSRLLGQRLLLNFDVYDTTVRDFQSNVVDTGPGALRGYLANVDKVRVHGAELDAGLRLTERWSGHWSFSWTDGKYASYLNGPCPLELIGNATTVCDLSGKRLSALPRWAVSAGCEYTRPANIGRVTGAAYLHVELTSRSKTFGDPSDSKYTVIEGYRLVNASVGFRQSGPWEIALWAKNLFDQNFMQNLTIQAGNSGLIVGTPGEPRLIGITVRARY